MLWKRLPSRDSTSRPSITCGTNFIVRTCLVIFFEKAVLSEPCSRPAPGGKDSGDLGFGCGRTPLGDRDAALGPVAWRQFPDHDPDRFARNAEGSLDRGGHRLVQRPNLLRCPSFDH